MAKKKKKEEKKVESLEFELSDKIVISISSLRRVGTDFLEIDGKSYPLSLAAEKVEVTRAQHEILNEKYGNHPYITIALSRG